MEDNKRLHPRLEREYKTISVMTAMYCHDLHGTSCGLCKECEEFLQYARKRLKFCKFQENKSTCGKCHVHCYKPEKRDIAIKIMRYSGPEMLFRHPWFAFLHLLDNFKSPKIVKKEK